MDNPRSPLWLPVALALVVGGIGLGVAFGFGRTAIAIAMFIGIAALGIRRVNKVVTLPPDDEVTDVSDYGLRYVCSMCGLQLRIETAARDKPPTHCMEPMVLERTGGKPPLRSL